MPDGHGPLASALIELTALGTGQDAEQLEALQDRLAAGRLRVAVLGEAQRGKSTLINALLGAPVLPTGVTPQTSVVTAVRYGSDARAEVRYASGRAELRPVTDLPRLVTEPGNPGNRRGIASVTVYADAPVLASGAELVDTPGSGSVLAWEHTAAARRAADLASSAVRQARRMTTAWLDQARADRDAARQQAAGTADRVEQFRTRLAEAATSSRDAVSTANGECARMLFALNDAVEADEVGLRRSVGSRLAGVLDGELWAATPAEIVALGSQRLASLARAAVADWHQHRQATIEDGLASLDARLTGKLTTLLGSLPGGGAELAGLELAAAEPGRHPGAWRLPGWAAETPRPGSQPPRARHRGLPGEAGRRRARQQVSDQLPEVVGSYLEDASAALRQQLTEVSRALSNVAEQRHAAVAGRLQTALHSAAELHAVTAAAASRTDEALDEREAAVRRAARLLAQRESGR